VPVRESRPDDPEERSVTVSGTPRSDGEIDEFAAFVARHGSSLGRLAFLLAGDAHGAEDLTADVFLAAWQQWDRVKQIEFPAAYLRQIMTNQAAGRYRRSSRERRGLERLQDTVPQFGHDPDSAAVVDVRSALQRLPPRRRACLVLRHAFDLPDREVAQILGVTVGAVKSQTHKAIAQMRHELGDVLIETRSPAGPAVSGGRWMRKGHHAE
jgi:RNA polymerase sigma-70 factor (sigma-E family)